MRVFVSYKRDVEPDEALAKEVCGALGAAGHQVFIDRVMPPGIAWAEEIERQIRDCDFFVVFLTAASSRSEMVQSEIEIARRWSKAILPVRVAFAGALPHPLCAYLDPIQYAFWRTRSDTGAVVESLLCAIGGAPLPSPPLPQVAPVQRLPPAPGGAVDLDDPHYLARSFDAEALSLARNPGQTVVLKGARQVGKTSLLFRLIDAAQTAGKAVAFADCQLLQAAGLKDPSVFYRWFVRAIGDAVNIAADDSVREPLDVTRWLDNCVLRKISTPLTLAIDESERLLWADFREDFFGMLRSWHNLRANPVSRSWKKLDLFLVTSTEPALLIQGSQSPFNVGSVYGLARFGDPEMFALNETHGEPLTQLELGRLNELVAGHPYLARKAMYEISQPRQTMSPERLFETAGEDDGPFRDHLRRFLIVLQAREMEPVLSAFRDVVKDRGCNDPGLAYRLESAGLVSRRQGKVVPTCKLYRDYFRERL